MSESDDSDILADIKALDEALALSVKNKSQEHISNSRPQSSNVSSIGLDFDDDNDNYINYLETNRVIDKSLNAYEINTRLITGLTIAKKKLSALLEECEQKIKLLDEKMMKSMERNLSSKLTISNAGMPYFKDKNYFSAPKNYDTLMKEARGELFVVSLKKPSRWSSKDRLILLNAIKDETYASTMPDESSQKVEESTSDGTIKKLMLPLDFNKMVGALGEREFDWYKISAMDFGNRHSPNECRAMWNVYLHPTFRKTEWTSTEDKKLLRYAKEYKYQDWDTITQKLGTNRSAYQCFIRFNTIKKVPSAGRSWTKQEDRHLLKIINGVKIGDYIPWTEVANHMRHRTKQQIYTRWMYRMAPHLRKGRFTYLETSALLEAVQKYGTNFVKISNTVMPNRSSIQLHQHYDTIMENKSGFNFWTINDDMMLINLHKKHSNNWSKIATYFRNKSRTQVRHRYTALLKYIMKGISIQNIPRPPIINHPNSLATFKKQSDNASKNTNKIESEKKLKHRVIGKYDIQLRLYETLCFPPTMKRNDPHEKLYNFEELLHETKKLYNVLNVLKANLDIPGDFLNYIQLNNREKQLLVSLKEYINVKKNKIQDNEFIEKFRTRMFGYSSEDSESEYFIPPLPFDGYVRTKRTINQKNKSIDCDLHVNEKFLVDIPAYFPEIPGVSLLVSSEENIQFHKLGQFLISDYHNYNQQNIDLYNSIKCTLSFDKGSNANKTSSGYNEVSANSKIKNIIEDYEHASRSKETISIFEEYKEMDITKNIILPNQATLLGLKNLFLWKLLYEHQNKSDHYETLAPSEKKRKRTTTDHQQPIQTENAEYQLLRTRLLQLFKLPIGLSNTLLQISGPEAIFLKEEANNQNTTLIPCSVISRKTKSQDMPMQLYKKVCLSSLNVPVDNNFRISDDKAENHPVIRSCKVIHKKYKVVPQ
ncbi:hypothetical protein P5V15_001578 [Pogonomyrmex californicus]